MAWERRGKRLVYYRTQRQGQKVVKRYMGTGLVARLASNTDEAAREAKRKERAEIRRIENSPRLESQCSWVLWAFDGLDV